MSDANLSFEDIHWSNKFAAHKHTASFKKHNKAIRSMIQARGFSYGSDAEKLLSVVQDKQVCAEQARLLERYLRNPKQYLTLDIDHISIFTDCSKNSVVKKLLDDDAICNPKTKARAAVLKVKEEPNVGKVHKKRYYDGKIGVKYTHRFSLTLFDNTYKRIQLYLADGTASKSHQKALRLDIIPSRFSDFELQIFFQHLSSIIGNTQYKQIIKQAECQRLDIGFNMLGVSQLFLFVDHAENQNINAGACFPNGDSFAETTYIGDRKQANHYIVYDKVLKELKKHAERYGWTRKRSSNLLKKCIVTSRIERRHFFGGKPLKLSNLHDANVDFEGLSFFNPKLLAKLEKPKLVRLLKNKSRREKGNETEKFNAWRALRRIYIAQKLPSFTLDTDWYSNEKAQLIDNFLATITLSENSRVPDSNTLEQYRYWWQRSETNKLFSFDVRPVRTFDPDKPDKPDRAWKRAVKSSAPLTVVYGGAGTGKTRLIAERAQYLADNGVKDNEITCLSFTNAAADELNQRFKTGFTVRPNVSTFTAWCGRQLKSLFPEYNGYRYIADTDDESGRIEALNKIIKDLDAFISASDVSDVLSLAKNDCKSISKCAVPVVGKSKVNACLEVIKYYEKYKKVNSLWDFEDVVRELERRIKDKTTAKKLGRKHKHLLLDEMQDTNRAQIKQLGKLLESGIELSFVGDISQSIYGFRGSKPELLTKFAKDKDANVRHLTRQYRASKQLLMLTNFVRQFTGTESSGLRVQANSDGTPPSICHVDRLDKVLKPINAFLKMHHNTDTLVLVRTNSMVKTLRTKLKGLLEPEQVITMHKAKGLECQNCIVIDPRFSGKVMDTKEEFNRLIYTAVTRPKDNLMLINSLSNTHYYKDGNDHEDNNILDVIASQNEIIRPMD
ncbi:UvrD-helicase domain-containing protein [Alteromonas sp. A079]|uniref:UvrD-helicase domain-containing protein n=1 Tax=Alteromonas sp. A079 TaxID=3410268 RepID=UPI003B9ED6F2